MNEATGRHRVEQVRRALRQDRSARRTALGLTAMLAGSALLAGSIAVIAQTSPSVPVRVGGDWEFAACSKRGTINGTETGGEFVPVNSTPTPSMRPIGRLPVGAEVYMCDENGTFVGIVYGEGDCGLDQPIERRAAYRGTCASGWVHNRSIDPADSGAV